MIKLSMLALLMAGQSLSPSPKPPLPAVAAVTPAQLRFPDPPTLQGNLAALFKPADLPKDARKAARYFSVEVLVGSDGSSLSCSVTSAPGRAATLKSLNAAVCPIISSGAKFDPPRRRSEPITGYYRGTFKWNARAKSFESMPEPVEEDSAGSFDSSRADAREVLVLSKLFGHADYPAAASRDSSEGSVEVELGIGADGAVQSCRVTQSSYSTSLDAATCRILRYRADFTPALDRHGQPVADSWRTRVGWRFGENP